MQVDEVVSMIRVALGESTEVCPTSSERPEITTLLGAVRSAMGTCAASVTYRLVEPSTILYSSPDGSAPPTIEPLAGTLAVVDAPYPYDFLPVQLIVAGVKFRSPRHFVETTKFATTLTCAGERAFGCLWAASFDHELTTLITLSIDGQDLRVGGSKKLEEEEVRRYPPLWGFELCGRIPGHCCGGCEDIRRGEIPGYILTIYALAEGPE